MILQWMHIIYNGKTNTSLPTVEFPSDLVLSYNENHRDNEKWSTKSYPKHRMSIQQRCQKKLGVDVSQKSLHLRDAFKVQATDLVNAKLDELDMERIMVPKNMTHLLQPLDLTTNSAMEKTENCALQFYRCCHKKIVKTSSEKCNYHGCRVKSINFKAKTRKSYICVRNSNIWILRKKKA